jgi:hypothetical protein
LQEPACSATCQRVLAIPTKKADRKLVTSLTRTEQHALLAAPDRTEWLGRRDHAILLLLLQTGLRVSEMRELRRQDIIFSTGPHVRCRGKGRKERCTPLTRDTVSVLRAWLAERAGLPHEPAFPSRRGAVLSRDAVERLVAKHADTARTSCASLRTKTVTPHVLRHTTAVTLLHAGNDRSVIALWLGHESIETTQMYLDADLSAKERALARTAPCRFSAAMDPAFSKPFPPGFLASHDGRSVADPPSLCPAFWQEIGLTRAKPLFFRTAQKRGLVFVDGPVVARGMTSAVREAAHAWIRREPPHQSFEHRTPWLGSIVRRTDIMIFVDGPVVVRGMTSAVREAAHAWIRREPPHQSFEHRMP